MIREPDPSPTDAPERLRIFGPRFREGVPTAIGVSAAVLVANSIAIQLGFGLSAAHPGDPLAFWLPVVLSLGALGLVAATLAWAGGREDAGLATLLVSWLALNGAAQVVAASATTMTIVAFAYGGGILVSVLSERPPWVLATGAFAALSWSVGLALRWQLTGDWGGEPGPPQPMLSLIPALVFLGLAKLSEFSLRAAQGTLGELDTALQSLEHYNDALVHARDQAESANRAKSAFLASMSHELRTPLNAIIGYSELVLEAPDDVEAVRTDITQVHVAGRHLLSLVNDVLDMSAIEAGKMELALEEVQIEQLLEGIIASVQPLVTRRGNVLETRIDPDLHSVWVDPLRLRQVVINLVSNAAKFTERGRISLTARKAGRGCAIDVQDTGPGIPADRLDNIFEPFEREGEVRKRQPGTGLGLTIARDLVQLMGGRIAVDSEVDVGTRFTVWLPSRRPARTAVRSAPRSLDPTSIVP